MMGVPGMRSVALPSVSYLAASRVRFMLRLWRAAGRKAGGLFDASGGQLVSR